MTPEQKARAYDEAIKKAVALYKASEPMSGCNVIIETLFPEIKESEDEKIRKALLELVHDTTGDELWIDYNVHKEEALDWLERQVEQNFEMKTAAESLGVDSKTYNKIVDECIFGEQKPEENKGNIGGISANPAWSEEDEELLKWSINNLTELKDRFGEEYGKVGKCIDWLKSLRPQSRWKPSDGDIIILEKVINGELEPKIFQATLQGILEQLKKLKEGKV